MEVLLRSVRERRRDGDRDPARTIFRRMDEDHSGSLGDSELRAVCASLGVELSGAGLNALMELLPTLSGRVAERGFIDVVKRMEREGGVDAVLQV